MEKKQKSAFDVICEHFEAMFGARSSPAAGAALPPQTKVIGWDCECTAFCVLRAEKGTVVVPWNPERDGRCYLASRIDPPRADHKGRSTAIVSCSPRLGWMMFIAYLDVWTEFDLAQVTKIIELKRMNEVVPTVEPPQFESPSIDGLPTPMTPIYRLVMFRDGGRCVLCGSTERIQFDHLIPRERGGADSFGNLRVLCGRCNLRKSNRV